MWTRRHRHETHTPGSGGGAELGPAPWPWPAGGGALLHFAQRDPIPLAADGPGNEYNTGVAHDADVPKAEAEGPVRGAFLCNPERRRPSRRANGIGWVAKLAAAGCLLAIFEGTSCAFPTRPGGAKRHWRLRCRRRETVLGGVAVCELVEVVSTVRRCAAGA